MYTSINYGSSSWLLPFVNSLGDLIYYDDNIKGIQYVSSHQSRLKKGKKGKNRSWWALDEDILDGMSEDEFAEFMQRVNDEVASKKTIYLTKCNGSKLAHPSWKKLLKTLSKTNVIELKGGDVSPVPIPPIPRPWLPLPPNPVNPPWLDDPDGDSDFNCVPGIPGGPCRPVLLVIPEVDCRLLENSDYSFNFDKYSDYNPWNCDEHHEWYPEYDDGDEVHEEIHEAWGKMRHCFCHILESAIAHAASCLERTNGEMNRTIIVQMSQNGIDMGLLDHPCYKCFKDAIAKLDRMWRRHPDNETGVELLLQIINNK